MFIISKVGWMLVQPFHLLLLCAGLAVLLAWRGRRRAAIRTGMTAACAGLAVSGLGLGTCLTAPLENRFPPLRELPPRVDGLLALGGALHSSLTAARGQTVLLDSAERLTALATLAQQRPGARVVFSGGDGTLGQQAPREADLVPAFLMGLGVAKERITVESGSRTTHENARMTMDLIRPAPGEVWLLITSAWHMPRAVACFEAAGWPVVPFPVDYTTAPQETLRLGFDPLGQFSALDRASREWLGLLAYRLLGRTTDVYPAPLKAGARAPVGL